MATTVWGNVNPNDGEGEQVYLTYNVTQTGSKYTVSLVAGIKATTNAISITGGGSFTQSVEVAVGRKPTSGSYTSIGAYSSKAGSYSLAKGSTRQHINTSYSVDKSKDGSQTLVVYAASDIEWLSFDIQHPTTSNTSYKEVTFSIPAKSSYTISFNANGGSGTVPSNISKWDSESITLPANTLTRTGYDFVGWGTTTGGGTVYPEGATYSGNADVTLYAIWQSNYVAPTISNLVAYRSTSAGVESDDDTYARVTFNYTEPELDYTAYSSYSIKVGYKLQTASTYTYQTVTGSSGTVDVVLSNIAAEYPYDIQVVISPTGYSDVTRNTYVSEAYYVMDINADGTAVSFFTAATQTGAIEVDGNVISEDLMLQLDTTAASGTDHDIYAALTTLGWDSDVIV